MRKGTKKKIIHGILIIIVIIFAFLASLVAAFRDVTVQSMIARSFAGELSKKLNTEVKIRTFYITYKLEMCVEGLQIKDFYNYPMFSVETLNARISPTFDFSDIRIRDAYLKDVVGRVVKYEGDDKLNFTDVFSQLDMGSDDEESSFHLRVDNLKIDNGRVVYWDQNRDVTEKMSMDYFHVDVGNIYGEFSNIELRNDTVFGDVLTLRGKDRSGLTLDDLSANVMYCENSLDINNLLLHSNETHLDLDLRFEYEHSSCYYEFEDSVRIISKIRPTTMLLSDLKYFSWCLKDMPDKFNFTANFDGYVKDFKVTDFVGYFGNNSKIDFDISFVGLPEFFDAYMDVNIRELTSTYDDTRQFAIPIEAATVPIPESFKDVGTYTLSGTFQGYAEDFSTKFNLLSEIGGLDADIYLRTLENSAYSFNISANDLKLDGVLGMDDDFETTFDLSLNGEGLDVDETDFSANLHFDNLKAFGNDFDNFVVTGGFKEQYLNATANVVFPFLNMHMAAGVDFTGNKPVYDIDAKIKEADLLKLKILDADTLMLLSMNVNAKFSGDDIDNIAGTLDIDSVFYFNGEEYFMKNFSANVTERKDKIKDILVDCDFFRFYLDGNINFRTFANEFKNTAKKYVNMPEWFADTKPDQNKQEFSLVLDLFDTETLTKLFMPLLYIAEGTEITASYKNGFSYHGSTIESPEIRLGNVKIIDLDVRNNGTFDKFISKINIEEIVLRDTLSGNPDKISIEKIKLDSEFANDVVKIDLIWDDIDAADHNKAHIISRFTPHEKQGGMLSVYSDTIIINDNLWKISKDCNIDFQKKGTFINNFDLYTESQKIAIHGMYPTHDNDTLFAEFHNVDISDFDFITLGDGIDFDGTLNGTVGLSGLGEDFSFSSNLDLKHFYLNGKEVGDVTAVANWYKPSESVMINMNVLNKSFDKDNHESMVLFGFYYPKKRHDNIQFDMTFNDFKLETVSPFVSMISRMNGFASGNLKLRGSVAEPLVEGKIKLRDAGCHINYLNTYYKINNDIKLKKNQIIFDNIILQDTIGNVAKVNGVVNHDHLKDFNLDLSMSCTDFLALNIPVEQADGFYGTAVADGVVTIKGPIDNIVMSADATTKKGTEINIPLSGSSTIDNNFIVFVNRKLESDTIVEKQVVETVKKEEDEFTMNLTAEVNSDAAVNIFLPQNMGNINARGNGIITLDFNSDDFNIRGNYTISSGTFFFTLEMVKRTFTLRNGGTIRWTGDPMDADIDIVGVYRTKSSLTSLGTSVVDSTALTNNINVDCIIRLTDKLTNPTLNFGIELPNAKEDTKNLVYSVIDTTNQALMAQQVFSLMVLGSFSYTAESNIARLGTTTGYGMITSQISNWLSQISEAFDIGINYTPNDRLTNEELEVALSTQLFDDRLTIEGNFGVIRGNRSDADNANNLVGDVDLTFRLTKRLSLKAYNHTNIKNNYYYYSYENYSDFTQGIGLSFSQSFDNIKEVFTIHKRNKNKKSDVSNGGQTPK